MAVGETYPAAFVDAAGETRFYGTIRFEDDGDQPTPGAPPITSGALPDTGAWVSGTAKVNPATRQVTVYVEIVGDDTNNAATCAIEISPDNVTYSTVGTPGFVAAVNDTGAITLLVPVVLPQGWYIKLTLAHCTVAASKYA